MTCPSTGSDPRDECKVGGPHFFEKIDPRDEKQLGMYGWHCVECGCARNGDGS